MLTANHCTPLRLTWHFWLLSKVWHEWYDITTHILKTEVSGSTNEFDFFKSLLSM